MRIRSTWLKRKLRILYSKIVRDRGTPEYIARGWTIGVGVGWIMPIGVQMIAAIPLAFLLRGSKIGATLGTCITNPLTVIVIYPAQCWIGNKVIGGHLSYKFIQDALDELLHKQSREALFRLSSEILTSYFIGGLLLTLVTAPVTYYLIRHMVKGFRATLDKHRSQKQA